MPRFVPVSDARLIVTEVADRVFRARTGDLVSWYLVVDGDAVLLVDAGYPADGPAVLASVQQVGRTGADVAAVVVTHAHADHLGGIARLQAAHGTPAHAGAADAALVSADALQQVTPVTVARNAWRPGVLPWAVRALRSGGTSSVAGLRVAPLPAAGDGGALDLPGSPVPVPTPGHSVGHTAFHLPDRGVLLTGDALVTAHPTSRRTGPQLLPGFFHHDAAGALASLAAIGSVEADVLLPGHGEPHRGDAAGASRTAAGLDRTWLSPA